MDVTVDNRRRTNSIPADGETLAIPVGSARFEGQLTIPAQANGLVILLHASGRSRCSPRNVWLAAEMQQARLATLLFDLLTPEEDRLASDTRRLYFDIPMLARRTLGLLDWLAQSEMPRWPVGFIAAGTASAAALIAASERPQLVRAVVARSSRADLATSALTRVRAPLLFLVGQNDPMDIERNRQALAQLPPDLPRRLVIVNNASSGMTEHTAWQTVSEMARDWLVTYLNKQTL